MSSVNFQEGQLQELAAFSRGPRPGVVIRELNPPAETEAIPGLTEGRRLTPTMVWEASYIELAGPPRRIQLPEGRVVIRSGREPVACVFELPRPGLLQRGGILEILNLTEHTHLVKPSDCNFGSHGHLAIMRPPSEGVTRPLFNGDADTLALVGLGANVTLHALETGVWVITGGHQFELK